MALPRGYQENSQVEGTRRKRGPRIWWIPQGTETSIVILDDDPVAVVRHRYYIRGDKDANDLRQTCFGMNPYDPSMKNACPRECLVCNAGLRHKEIDRGTWFYYSVIDERKYEWKNQEYKDQKKP